MKVLLTGGCGFIGSHQAVVLIEQGHEVVIVDDLSNARASVVDRIERITGVRPALAVLDVRNTAELTEVVAGSGVEAVLHFAGLKHVAESMERPVDYFDVNLAGLTSLLQACDDAEVRRLIFSSSGSIYGAVTSIPIPETAPACPTNPYSQSKAICEQILSGLCAVDRRWSIVSLRYFNPAGAHRSGMLGEDPTHLLTNLLPVLMEVAAGERASITINGSDFDTHDGTAVRDYVHVMDVAIGHARALELLSTSPGFEALNIGRGQGVSVLDLVAATERVTGRKVPTVVGPRRPGDVGALVADTGLAADRLGLTDYRPIDDIVSDAWRFRLGLDG